MSDNDGLRKLVGRQLTHLYDKLWKLSFGLIADEGYRQHFRQVELNLKRLILKNVGGSYSHKECLLLAGAAALHDVLKTSPEITRGTDHGTAAAGWLPGASDCLDDANGPAVLSMIGAIVRIHDQGPVRSVPRLVPWDEEQIRLPRLALAVKLADMLDCTAQRLNQLRLRSGLDQAGPKEDARQAISGWELVDADTLSIQLAPRDNAQMKHAIKAVQLMDAELRQHEDALHLLGLPSKIKPTLLPTVDSRLTNHFNESLSSIETDDLLGGYKFPIRRHSGILVAFLKKTISPLDILLHWKPEWKQWLFPSVPMPLNLVQDVNIVSHFVANKYHLKPDQFALATLGGIFYDQKISPAHQCMTEYSFRIAAVVPAGAASKQKWPSLPAKEYQWFRLADCRKRTDIQERNDVVWRHIEEILEQLRS